MRVKLSQFSGEKPRYRPTQLPDNAGVVCRNARLDAGALQPLKGYDEGETLVLTGNDINGIYLWRVGDDEYWLRFAEAVSITLSPISDDAYRRIYWTGDSRLDGAPKYSYTPAVYTGGSEYPINFFKLGIPAPTSAPTVAITINPGNPNDEARVYVYTYVGKLGEESAPSPPSSVLIVPHEGATVEVSGLIVDSGASTGREIEKIRIYRSVVDSSGQANFFFVADILIASNAYTDTLSGSAIASSANSIRTTGWDEPRADMQGLGLSGFGVSFGFSGNIICFSEPFVPYAWPRDFELTTDFPIVAIGAYDSYFIVGTTGRPVMVTGIEPSSMSQQELPIIEACVSAKSMANMGHSVIYASPNGLVMAAGGTAQLITESIITLQEWQALNPSSIHAYEHRGYYVFFWKLDEVNKGGFIFDPRNAAMGFVSLSRWFVTGHRDILTDKLWLLDEDGNLFSFDDDGASLLTQTFRSKIFTLPSPKAFLAGQVIAESYADTTMNVFANGALLHSQVVTNQLPFRLPRNGRKREWQVEVVGKDVVRELCVAETIIELQQD